MIVSLSLHDEIVNDLDRLIQERGYKGRSEVVRAALRDFLERQRREGELKGHVHAVVTLSYPERMERELADVRHQHNDLVKSMLHGHSDAQRCTTILQCEGPDVKMRKFFAELRGLRHLHSIDINVV